jgi:hypothetical protein
MLRSAYIFLAFLLSSLAAGQQPQSGQPPAVRQNAQADSTHGGSRATSPSVRRRHPNSQTTAAAPSPSYVHEVLKLAPAGKDSPKIPDAKTIIASMGNPEPFKMKPVGSDRIVISSSDNELSEGDRKILQQLIINIGKLRTIQNVKTVQEIYIPHASSMGSLLDTVNGLNYKTINVEAVGRDKIRVTYGSDVTPEIFSAFLRDLSHLAWQAKPQSPVARVFYVKTSEAAAALSGSSQSQDTGRSGQSDAGTDKAQNVDNGTADTSDGGSKDDGTSGTKESDGTTTKSTASKAQKRKTADKKAARNKNNSGQDGKKDTGKDNKKGKGNQTQDPPASGDSPASSDSGTANNDSSNNGDNAKANVTSVNGDTLIFPGDEKSTAEAKRVLAAIDFPRPEIIINAWSFQASSSNPATIRDRSNKLRRTVSEFNDSIQQGINRAWNYLQDAISTSDNFFDPDFYGYLTKQYVANSDPSETERLTEGPAFLRQAERNSYGICNAGQYCLGYSSLFRPLRPTLTDMLLAVIAANDPEAQIREAVAEMDNLELTEENYKSIAEATRCDDADRAAVATNSTGTNLANELISPQPNRSTIRTPMNKLPMFCFWQEVQSEFPENGGASRIGVLRAAIANFLFHYKMAEQYPHEFSAYDLSQSAQEMNSQLNPLIVAFNRDIVALLDNMSNNAEFQLPSKNGIFGFAGHGSSFINNGIITVRTISGTETKVDTATQNFFDATNPPSAADIIKGIGSAEQNVPGVLKTNLTANEAATIIGAVNSAAPSDSKIGREFDIDITPHSLSGASSAELDVSMTSQESAEPTLYNNGSSSGSDNLSRVAKHNIQTKVRLESIKLFEISAFSAFLERSRRNFPLFPPFIELPYIGSFLSVPVPGAKEYHQSTAVMSAIVVPTAADLANGLRFTSDRVAVQTADHYGSTVICSSAADAAANDVRCNFRKALSLSDLGGYSIYNYNRAKIACLASANDQASPFGRDSQITCGELTLSGTPQDAP